MVSEIRDIRNQLTHKTLQYIDAQLTKGEFALVNGILKKANPVELGVLICISALTSTMCAKEKLKHRVKFYDRVRDFILLNGGDADNILKGLE